MSRILPKQEAIPRTEMIALLRAELVKLTDEDNSICKVASERGIFCKGFHRNSDGGLRRCYSWLLTWPSDVGVPSRRRSR